MLSEQAVKSWPLEKYAKFVAPKETPSTHKQGYWKVCMLRIFKSKNCYAGGAYVAETKRYSNKAC